MVCPLKDLTGILESQVAVEGAYTSRKRQSSSVRFVGGPAAVARQIGPCLSTVSGVFEPRRASILGLRLEWCCSKGDLVAPRTAIHPTEGPQIVRPAIGILRSEEPCLDTEYS